MTGQVISKCSKSCTAFLLYLYLELLVVIMGAVIVSSRILIIKLVFVSTVKHFTRLTI